MKKIIVIAGLITLSSCADNTPKCDDKKVTDLVLSILDDNKENLQANISIFGLLPFKTFKKENAKVINIMTISSDEKLSICGCEGSVKVMTKKSDSLINNITYTAQMNSENEVVVKVNNVGPFQMNE